MGFSRDTIYRYKSAVEEGGIEALFDKSRRQPNLKNRVDDATQSKVLAFAIEFSAFGQLRASNELRKQGIFVSPSGVQSIWLRFNLESTLPLPHTLIVFKLRANLRILVKKWQVVYQNLSKICLKIE